MRNVGYVLAVYALALAAIAAFHTQTLICLAALSSLVCLCALRWRQRRDLILGFTGSILGPAVEWFAVQSNLWTYAHPDFGGLPLWTIPMWWMFPVTAVKLIEAATGPTRSDVLIAESAAMVGAVVPTICLWGNTRPALAFLITVLFAGVYLVRHRTRCAAATIMVCALMGTAAEIFLVATAAWKYPASAMFGVPLWLPLGYSAFGAGMIGLGLGIHRTFSGNVTAKIPVCPRAAGI